MSYIETLGKRSKTASYALNRLAQEEIVQGLTAAAEALRENADNILAANTKDVARGEEAGMSKGLLDRLRLSRERIDAMADGILQVAALKSPIGAVQMDETRPNGLHIQRISVPLGVIGIIYESRPNVTADAFALCFKTQNSVILRGGSDAIDSNLAIAEAIRGALKKSGLPEDALLLVEKTDRETVREMMQLREYIDLLIPRGGAGLIAATVRDSTIPVIETGTGNCHIFVDEEADVKAAVDIIENAKTQRLGVCNALESLVVHEKIAEDLLPAVYERLSGHGVTMRGDEAARTIVPEMEVATEEDFGTEYLDAILSIKTVDSLDAAIDHINRYSTHHSESILTTIEEHGRRFLHEIDSACVYVNASTRFTDGFEFGFGAEIGISTQKLHARGPMGLEALTSMKYVIVGDGQTRP